MSRQQGKGIGMLAVAACLCGWLLQADGRAEGETPLSWGVFYGPSAPKAALARPDWLVLEPDHGWDPATFRREGQVVFAYLSLGEVHESRDYFPALQANEGALLGRNPHWPKAWRVNPSHPVWRDMLLERLVGGLAAKGFDGLFLDTLDVAEELARSKQFPNARQATLSIITAIHARYPHLRLVANGGQALVPEIVPCLSAFAVESVFTDYHFTGKTYAWRRPQEANQRASALQALQRQYRLPVLVLEYRQADDRTGRVRAVQLMRAAGFVPFVSTIALDRLSMAEP